MDIDPLPSMPVAALLSVTQQAIEFSAPANWLAWWTLIIIVVLCLATSAFVSGSEIAFFGLSRQDIEELEESDSPKDARIIKLLSNSERLLATILISNNLVNITMVVLLTFAINQTVKFNHPVISFLVQTVFMTLLLLLFGEIFPKLVARGRMMKWIRMSVGGISFLYTILKPVASLMVKSTSIVNKVITKKKELISTDQLEKALEISDVKDVKEKEMLDSILTFGEKEVRDIMISRVDVTSIDFHDSWQEVNRIILESGFSRIPIYDTSSDSIRGILYSKDLLPYIGKVDNSFEWQKLIRDAYFVPESRMIDDLLEDFRTKKIHIAIVIDEYGGNQGIVTLEDIIEEIVGDIDDEYDEASTMYKTIGPDQYIFEAKIPLDDFCRVLHTDEGSLGDVGDAETLAGYLLELKGDFPTLKEVIETPSFKFRVLQMERHRIVKVRVDKKSDAAHESKSES